MLSKISRLFYFSGLAIFLNSCYPEQPEAPVDLDIIITNYDPSYNFTGKNKYYLFDTVTVISEDTLQSSRPQNLRPELNDFIINKIVANLSKRGYERLDTITPSEEPDFIFLASFMNTNISGTTYYPSNYGYSPWYGSYYGWGAGWGYYTPYYPVNYSYNTGTVFIELIDPKGADNANKQIPVVWRAIFNGVLTNVNDLIARLDEKIDQAFTQSPYIHY